MSEIPLPASPGLTPAQFQVAAALASGATISSAAQSNGIHRSTIHNWLRDSPGFSAAVEAARLDFTDSLRDRLQDLSILAVQTLEQLLQDPDTPASVRLRAALAVLNRQRFPKDPWATASDADAQAQRERDRLANPRYAEFHRLCELEAAKNADEEPVAVTELVEEKGNPTTPSSEDETNIRHDSTLFDTFHSVVKIVDAPPPPVHRKIGRNAPCPCKSGRKYKHCCAKVPLPVIAA